MFYFIFFVLGFIICTFLTYLIIQISYEKKIFNKEGIPFLGSIAICLSVFHLTYIFNYFSRSPISGIFLPATLILILGLIDDFRPLSPFTKIFVQIIAALLLILNDIRTQIIFINPFLNIILTIFWVLLITNAFNLLDIMDGLAGGLAFIISLTFFIISVLTNNLTMGILSISLAGSILAFLRYNFPPAKIYMGNAGSLLIGFLLSVISLSISYASLGREVALLTPLIILGLPLYDTGFVILMRLIRRKSPIRKSKDHFALRLLALGYTQKKVLILMFLFGFIFSIYALLISMVPNISGLILIAILISVCFAVGRQTALVNITDD